MLNITLIEKIKTNLIFIFCIPIWFIIINILRDYILYPITDNMVEKETLFYFVEYMYIFFVFYFLYYTLYILPFDLYNKNIEYMNKLKKRYLIGLIVFIIFKIYLLVFYFLPTQTTM